MAHAAEPQCQRRQRQQEVSSVEPGNGAAQGGDGCGQRRGERGELFHHEASIGGGLRDVDHHQLAPHHRPNVGERNRHPKDGSDPRRPEWSYWPQIRDQLLDEFVGVHGQFLVPSALRSADSPR